MWLPAWLPSRPTPVALGDGFQDRARFAVHRGSHLDVQHLDPPRCPDHPAYIPCLRQ
jgi:hypothetical protein